MDNKIKDITNRINIITEILKKSSINKQSEKDKIFFKKILTTLEKVLEYIRKNNANCKIKNK